jgi:hypothetical protein
MNTIKRNSAISALSEEYFVLIFNNFRNWKNILTFSAGKIDFMKIKSQKCGSSRHLSQFMKIKNILNY